MNLPTDPPDTGAAPAGARERILDTAARLFYRDGLRATGIDRIIAEAEVAKASFYRHFPSKGELIAAFLQRRHEQWMAWFAAAVERRLAAGEGLPAVAGALGEWFAEEGFRGCAFINAVAEDGVSDSEARALARRHKEELQQYLAGVAGRLQLAPAAEVAAAALLVADGMIVRYQMARDLQVVATGRGLLDALARGAASPAG